MKLSKLILAIAAAEVGVEEKPRGSNRGPRVDQYQAATWLDKKDWGAWCASYVDWVVMKAMEAGAARGVTYTFKRPRTAGAWDLQRWSLAQDHSTNTRISPGRDIQPGDIVIFKHSHVGFATGQPDGKGYFSTNEGNTNTDGGREGYAVFARRRHVSEVKTRIRFTV